MKTVIKKGLFMTLLSVALIEARTAGADLSFNAEVRETYEDNVIGILSDNPNITGVDDKGGQGRTVGGVHLKGGIDDIITGGTGTGTTGAGKTKGDFSTGISFDVGTSTDLNDDLAMRTNLNIHHTEYNTYKEFNFTIGGLSMGLVYDFTDDISGTVMLTGAVKKFKNSQRDSTAIGAIVRLKDQLTESFSLQLIYDFEQNHANSRVYSYDGNSIGLWMFYGVTEKSTVGLAYSYLVRNFTVPSSFKITAQTATFDWTWNFSDDWSVNAGYDHEWGDSSFPNTATTNNVYSLALLYGF